LQTPLSANKAPVTLANQPIDARVALRRAQAKPVFDKLGA
jgi:hypothetical protein